MTVCHGLLQYTTQLLSFQSKSNELREAREVFFQWLSGHSQTVCQQFDAHQGISEQALDSAGEAMPPKVDNTKWLPLSILSDGVRCLASPKTSIEANSQL